MVLMCSVRNEAVTGTHSRKGERNDPRSMVGVLILLFVFTRPVYHNCGVHSLIVEGKLFYPQKSYAVLFFFTGML